MCNSNEIEEFKKASRPLIKYLCQNYNKHSSVIVTQTGAIIVEGKISTGEIIDYIVD